MLWNIEYTDEFGEWWESLTEVEKDDVEFVVLLLGEQGSTLGYPYSSKIQNSRYNLRELRIQCQGKPYRVLYAFDPRRTAILLLGGNKTGDERWYQKQIPLAEKLYQEHLEALQQEGLISTTISIKGE
ncbi:addiction module toxin RelE [Candidatus Thiomargarita nelsonii]|uniref:Addiction module toxin RelE n=1 Tax=Candidatus Thiomargarita nelsonii TaxID=1003181 RepID=A0A4E0QMY0_9GAMM|nr:addiction module toxin RelE [Candidatus Thiomargarita nelsonii]TGO02302.1 addiction module toxin RelE [Candidatus Thiomargarita nelsonii]